MMQGEHKLVKIEPDEVDLSEIGGLRRRRGSIWGFSDENEFLPELRGRRAIQTYREMSLNDPIVGGMLFAIKMLIRQVSWTVEPAGSSNEDMRAYEFLKSCYEDLDQPWDEVIDSALSCLIYGWSVLEIVYKLRRGDDSDPRYRSRYSDGLVGWRKFAYRPQDTIWEFVLDTSGELAGVRQQRPDTFRLVFIPAEKLLLFRTTTESLLGRSILRTAYRPWYFKKRIQELEGIGIERDLAGIPVVRLPAQYLDRNAPAELKAVRDMLREIARNLRNDEQAFVELPSDTDERGNPLFSVELLRTGGAKQFSTDKIVQRYNSEIAMSVLADFILLGHKERGSFALASEKTTLFATAIGAWLDSIAEVFNRYAVPRLFRLNNFKVERLPKIVHGDIEIVDPEEIGKFVSQLAGAGMELFPDEELERNLRAMVMRLVSGRGTK